MNGFDDIDIAEILVKRVLETASVEEEERLQQWIDLSGENRRVYEDFVSGRSFTERKRNFSHLRHEKTMVAIHEKINQKMRRRMFVRAAVVAAMLVVAVLCTMVVLQGGKDQPEVLPGSEGKHYAILSVDDGQQVVLRESDTGSEWLEHVKGKVAENKEVQMIRLEVPRGSEYRLRLNDSTEVWLNSETVLTYPDRFVGGKREVFLSGEAFFEVKSNPARPFEVRTKEDLLIRVTGTRLNVRDYADEPFLKVTLIKGVVYVGNDSVHRVLVPSEQAVFNRETGNIQVVMLEDPSTCVAWREGMFAFEGEAIPVIFAALAQWYDIEFVIENEGALPGGRVTFHATRDEKVEELLGVLQSLIDFKYRMEGRKIYIRF